MIRHIPPAHPALMQMGGHPLLLTAIGGRAACPQGGMEFWMLTLGDGEEVCLLCRNGSTLYMTGEQGHGPTLAEFAKQTGFVTIMTDLALPLEPRSSMAAMAWGGGALPNDQTTQQVSAVEFARLQLRCGVFSRPAQADDYAVNLSHAIRHGGGAAFVILSDGQPIAGAAVRQITGTHAMIEGVAVSPAHRRAGLGTAVTAAAARWVLERNRQPLLCCKPALVPFYRGAGFVPAEPIWRYGKD